MKLSKFFAVSTIGLSLGGSAFAVENIYIAGAPAIRQQLTTAIEALVDAGETTVNRAFNGSNIVTANVVEWEGAKIAGQDVNIYLTYNGSAGGYQATSGNKTVRFLPIGLPPGSGKEDVLSTTNAQVGGLNVQNVVPHFHIANEFQVSTPWIGTNNVAFGPGNSTYESLEDVITGILPLRLVASPAAPANLNITPQLVRTLYLDGEIRLSQLTGLSTDFNKKVYPLSRGIDSGIRTLWAANNGLGTSLNIVSYQPTVTVAAGPVLGTVITSGGSGYTTAPGVAFAAPPSGTTATGTANISGGKVVSITITNPGTGYTGAPAVTFSGGGGGKLAAATAVIGGGTANTHVPYPAGTVIGVPYVTGNGGYPTFGPLLTALTSTLNLSGGNAGDIYFTVLSDSDAQVALAAGAKEVSWNGNKLGTLGTYGNIGGVENTPTGVGSSSPALSNGQYELWGYVRLASKSSLSGVPRQVRDAIATRLRDVEGPVLLKDVNIQRDAPDGGPIFQGQRIIE